jgi:tetratricopeptide (TPR) repeat protein
MNKSSLTHGWLAASILAKHELTPSQFAKRFGKRYEFSRASAYRWASPSSVEMPPYGFLQALAEIENVHVWELMKWLEEHEHSVDASAIQYSKLKLFPLITNIDDRPELQPSIAHALEARRLYVAGNLIEAGHKFEWALQDADKQKARLYAAYLRGHLLNIHEMTGSLSRGQAIYDKARRDIEETKSGATKTKNEDLKTIANRLELELELRWFWLDFWGRGARVNSLGEGQLLLDKIRDANVIQKEPYLLEFIARCHVALGEYEQAVDKINEAERLVYALRNPIYARNELFLDSGGSMPDGTIDYTWQEDQIRAAKFDILLAASRVKEAFDAYRSITIHYGPQTHLSIHRWWHPLFQAHLMKQNGIAAELDVKRILKPDEYERELAKSGDLRVQASNLVSLGHYYIAHGNFAQAFKKYQDARRIAHDCSAQDIEVEAGIGLISISSKIPKQQLDLRLLNVIKETLRNMDNPYLRKQFEDTVKQVRG